MSMKWRVIAVTPEEAVQGVRGEPFAISGTNILTKEQYFEEADEPKSSANEKLWTFADGS